MLEEDVHILACYKLYTKHAMLLTRHNTPLLHRQSSLPIEEATLYETYQFAMEQRGHMNLDARATTCAGFKWIDEHMFAE